MDELQWLTDRFERHRAHRGAVAYRTLGSVSEADDALQEAWLRIRDQDPAGVNNMQAWLTTIVGRVCLNMLVWADSQAQTCIRTLGVSRPVEQLPATRSLVL